MRSLFQNFRNDESGATLIEYGVALLVAIIVGGTALVQLGGQTSDSMFTACDGLQPTNTGAITVTWDDSSTLGCDP